ncbi:MAG: glutamine--fructose-6-phosphate aminotransferase, partial [Bacteroidota bacterium]
SNVHEVIARKGRVIDVVHEGEETISKIPDHLIKIPATEEPIDPLQSVIPLQLLSYHIAVELDKNVDQPRNLAKSVTVE